MFAGITYVLWSQSKSLPMNAGKDQAIEKVKQTFPELADYPSDTLPPKSIQTEEADGGWYVAFIQEGSGRPIIGAKCYFVDDNGAVIQTGTYTPADTGTPPGEFLPKLCSPGE